MKSFYPVHFVLIGFAAIIVATTYWMMPKSEFSGSGMNQAYHFLFNCRFGF
ncbi:MAG: hypothetical protein M0P38_04195 [Bacteroidales bacterium]|nr:hypothetical protein [Bacteroidales bacterium]